MTEAVPLGELLHEEALFGLTGVRQVGVPRGCLFPSRLCLSANTSSSLGVARPFTNNIEKGWKKCTDPMVGGARSITLYDECTPSSASKYQILKSVRVHFAYGRIALTLELLSRFGRFLDEDDRCNPPVLLIPFPEAPRALNQKLTVLP